MPVTLSVEITMGHSGSSLLPQNLGADYIVRYRAVARVRTVPRRAPNTSPWPATSTDPRPFEQLYADSGACCRRRRGPRPCRAPHTLPSRLRRAMRSTRVQAPRRFLRSPVSCGAQWRAQRAKRWGWITINPPDAAQRPRMPAPQPDLSSVTKRRKSRTPPGAQNADWGAFFWLTLITGDHHPSTRRSLSHTSR